MKKKENKKILWISLGVIIFLVILVSSILFYFWFSNKIAQDKLSRMQDNMKNISSLEYEGSLNIFGEMGESNIDVKLSFVGSTDSAEDSDQLNLKASGFFDTIPLGGELAYIRVGQNSYFEFIKFPEIIKAYERIENTENRWAHLTNQDDLSKLNFITEEKIFLKQQYICGEEVKGNDTNKYLVTISNDSIKKIFNSSNLSFVLTDTEVNNLNKAMEKISDLDFYLWVGKESDYLYKIEGEVPFNFENGDSLRLGISLILNNFNQTKAIEAPEVYEEASEVFKELIN